MDRKPAFFLLLIALFLAFGALLALPLLQYLLFAILLAYVLFPVQRRLAPRIGPRVAAGSIIVGTVFVVLVPFGILANVVIGQALTLIKAVRGGELDSDEIEAYLFETFGIDVDIEEIFRSLFENGQSGLVDNVVELLGGLTDIFIGLTVLLFALYYLLVDGNDLVAWLRDLAPIEPGVQDELATRIDRVMWGVFVVNVLVAVVQGVLTGIGFVIVGVPNVIFWTVMTVMLALLPLIGAFVVWAPASAYLILTGQVVPGVILFAYGATVVSFSDNYLRPVAGGHEAHLNPGLFVVGIFGGVAAMGFMGVFFGPVILGILKALLDLSDRALGGDVVAVDRDEIGETGAFGRSFDERERLDETERDEGSAEGRADAADGESGDTGAADGEGGNADAREGGRKTGGEDGAEGSEDGDEKHARTDAEGPTNEERERNPDEGPT